MKNYEVNFERKFYHFMSAYDILGRKELRQECEQLYKILDSIVEEPTYEDIMPFAAKDIRDTINIELSNPDILGRWFSRHKMLWMIDKMLWAIALSSAMTSGYGLGERKASGNIDSYEYNKGFAQQGVDLFSKF
jgi:hypothetical protein